MLTNGELNLKIKILQTIVENWNRNIVKSFISMESWYVLDAFEPLALELSSVSRSSANSDRVEWTNVFRMLNVDISDYGSIDLSLDDFVQ